jgi:serine/threonine protein kinase
MIQPDTLLQNRYRIISQISKGGMGTVYLAKDDNLGILVAVKQNIFEEQRLIEAFKREARLLASLRHSALPQIKDHFIVEDVGQFLVMEYISGDDLEMILEKRRNKIEPVGYPKPFDIEEIIHWAEQLLDALDYLHTRPEPVIHRDIKPQNLKIAERKQIILLDFGLAKGKPVHMTRVTTTGSLYGYTPNYAPIEQIRGVGTDPRSDLYALGATLYHLTTGFPPSDAATRADAFLGGEADPLLEVNRVNPKCSKGFADLLMKAMQQHRNNRPASAAEMLKMLRAVKNSTVIDWQAKEGNEKRQQQEEQARLVDIRRQEAAFLKAESDRKQEEETIKFEEAEKVRRKEERERKAQEDAERQKRLEEDKQKQQQEEERQAREEAARLNREREEAERKRLQEEQERRAREEIERKNRQEELSRKEEAERLRKRQDEERKTREETERKQAEEEQRKAREQAENHRAKVKQLVSEGIAAFDSGKHKLAIQKWNEVLKASPNEHGIKESIEKAETLINKEQTRLAKVKQLIVEGTKAFDTEQYKVAIDKWNEALALSPNEQGIQGSIKAAYQRWDEKEKEKIEQLIKAEQERKAREAQQRKIREEAESEAQQRSARDETEKLRQREGKQRRVREEHQIRQQKAPDFGQLSEEVFGKINKKHLLIGLMSVLLIATFTAVILVIISNNNEPQPVKNANQQQTPTAPSTVNPGVFVTPSKVYKVSLSDDGRVLASAGDENKVRLWQRRSVRMLEGQAQKIGCVAVSRDGQTVVAGGDDGSILLWRVSDGQLVNTLKAHSDYIFSVGFNPEGKSFYSASGDKTVKLWRASDSEPLVTVNTPEQGFLIVAVSPDLKFVGFYHPDRRFKLWSTDDDSFLRYLDGKLPQVTCGAFSNDSQMLALGSRLGEVQLWRAGDGKIIKTLAEFDETVVSLAFSTDGQRLAAGLYDGKIKLLSVSNGSLLKTLEGHTGAVNSLSFSADSRALASGSDDNTVRVWSLE